MLALTFQEARVPPDLCRKGCDVAEYIQRLETRQRPVALGDRRAVRHTFPSLDFSSSDGDIANSMIRERFTEVARSYIVDFVIHVRNFTGAGEWLGHPSKIYRLRKFL
ncbi:hypothetical protein GCM10009555_038750 [Acrocarpospora macrocephala]